MIVTQCIETKLMHVNMIILSKMKARLGDNCAGVLSEAASFDSNDDV